MERYINAYKKLYETVYENPLRKYKEVNLSNFVAMRGKNYNNLLLNLSGDSIRLMVVGRATNGWRKSKANITKQEFADTALSLFESSDRFDTEWRLKDVDTNPYSEYESPTKKDANGNPIIERYYFSKSPFWSSAAQVWYKLNNTAPILNWFENIAWSNIYKVAPFESGNPSTNLIYSQANACVEILREEMRLLKPTHVLLVIDKSWVFWSVRNKVMFNFMDAFENVLDMFDSIPENQNIVQGAFTSNNSKVLITCRPETVSRVQYADTVIETFSKM